MDVASEDPVCLLVEILKGTDLLIRDKKAKSSDPYIKVKLNGKDIHQTKVISKTLNPVYGEAQNNAFILDCSAKQLFDNQGLLFKVKDHNRLQKDEDMGSVQVPAMEIYKATGTPMDFVVETPSDCPKGTSSGTISIRCWPATEAHLKKYGANKKGLLGFIQTSAKKAEERAKEVRDQAKESMHNIKQDLSQKMHVPEMQMPSMPEIPVPFAKKEEIEPDDTVRSSEPAETAREISIDSLPKVDSEPDLVQVEKEDAKVSAAPAPVGAHIMEKRKIVVEVVAGRDILIGDTASSDPYVKVMLGDKEVHKTKHLTKTLNPVFTPQMDSTFILECTDAKLSDKNGLVFIMKDWDMIGGNETLGTIQVPYTTIIKGDGEPLEFAIAPPKGINKDAGYMLIRCRPATPADEKAMADKKNKPNLFPTTTVEAASTAWKPQEKETEPKAAAPEAAAPDQSAEDVKVKPKDGEELHVKIEIVACRGLIAADKNGLSDPYVKLSMGGKELHKTKHIDKTLNPSFEDKDNIFTLHCPASELFEVGGLGFKVKDWDRFGANDDLGELKVSAAKIYTNMHGDSMDLKITPPKGKENDDAGFLTIRCTSTTSDDHTGEKKKFMGMTVPVVKAPVLSVPKVAGIFSKDRAVEIDMNEEEEAMFIQIVNCRNLLVADKTGASDPYVKVKLGKKDLHETKHIPQTLNPNFSSQHNCFFVMEARPSEVRAAGGVTFKIKDWDRVGANDDLGTVTLDAETFFKCEGGNMELKIKPPKGIGEDAGTLTVRVRPATESDRAMKRSVFGGLSQTLNLQDYGKVDLHLLVEVVSAWQIPIADLTSSDPYVKVKVGPRNVHETKPINKTRDPIYTIKHDSVFILDIATKELTENAGITFKLKDYDMIGKNDDLCEVTYPAEKILEAKGERVELDLKAGDNDAGGLAIRIRPATAYDRDWLKNMKSRKNRNIDFMDLRKSYEKTMKPLGGTGSRLKTLMTKMKKKVDGVDHFRVRPYPDPERKEVTEFMSEADIETECFKPSKKWLDIGTGGLGKVFVEILGADGLPNKDHDLGGGNKTDPFVSVVYEDSVAKTDIIDDCLSPRWMPWMQRAFVFRMMHTSSNLHIGVFDFDAGFATDHDICGRVSIDLANFQPDTEYILRYNIYENSVMPDREAKGILMVRLRMELQEERDLILSNLQLPPEFFLNVKEGKDFDLVRQTVGGRQDMLSYSQKTIQLYVDELMGYKILQYYLTDSIKALLFWRGQVRFYGIWLPMHSVAIFLAGITLAERPSLFPSYYFFSLAWFLLAVQTWRNNSINPWHKTKTFMGLTQELLTGTSFDGPATKIAAHEKEVESQEEQQQLKDRIEKARKAAEEYAKAQMQLLEEHESMMASVGDQTAETDISTKGGGLSIDPLKFILYPIQQYLAMACDGLRLVKNVFIWDEPYLAYIFTLAFFAIGLVFLIVPWAFIIRWTSRILAWLLLGPHMKLIDVYWYSGIENQTEEQQREQIKEALSNQLDLAKSYAADARLRRENAIKMKDIKSELYGSFITRIPVLRSERFADVPLHSSTATPFKPSENLSRAISERVPGQHLVGDMIPRIAEDEDASQPAKDGEEKKKD